MPKNEMFLEGLVCPKCGQLEPLQIVATSVFDVSDSGVEGHRDVEWEDDSPCYCPGCDHSATVADFKGCPNCDGQGRDTCPLCSGTNTPFPEEQTGWTSCSCCNQPILGGTLCDKCNPKETPG